MPSNNHWWNYEMGEIHNTLSRLDDIQEPSSAQNEGISFLLILLTWFVKYILSLGVVAFIILYAACKLGIL